MGRSYPICVTIAGSDSCGGAGIQADIKTFSALGVYGMSVITAITAQNSCGVQKIEPVSTPMVKAQIDALFQDFPINALKLGMLHSAHVVDLVADAIEKFKPRYIVFDPVMISTSGCSLIQDQTVNRMQERLFKLVTITTPNISEAQALTNIAITNKQDMLLAAEKLIKKGCQAVLIKGGDLENQMAIDLLVIEGKEPLFLQDPKIKSLNTHGTGCTLSSAIAAYLALDMELEQAVLEAKKYISQAIKQGADIEFGNGYGPVNHLFDPKKMYIRLDKETLTKT